MSDPYIIDLIDDSDDDEENVPIAAEDGDSKPAARVCSTKPKPRTQPSLPSSLVLEDDQAISEKDSLVEDFQRAKQADPSLLFQDDDFSALPSSIQGQNKKDHPNCRCRGSQKAKLSYNAKGRPYYACAKKQCQYFSYAFVAQSIHWYRFGSHTRHQLVAPSGFSAGDLSQGRIGDCWFLSALAVVAQRPDLIGRLFGNGRFAQLEPDGLVRVNLFLDGFWKTVVMDNFLPCLVDSQAEGQLQQALRASLGAFAVSNGTKRSSSSSKYDPHAIADSSLQTLRDTREFLEQHQRQTLGTVVSDSSVFQPLERPITSQDLAYSKAKHNQLWIPFLEKAYAKSHGSYSAISGGHIAEAFLDLTGAPTLVFPLQHGPDFEPQSFWYQLLRFRQQHLPMGCGTDSSAAGIVGMHAYSILDVREVKNVAFSFFQETGAAHGGVSGFTEYDGTVRLLQIRNPHGKGEWKGDFSDQSQVWEKLLQHSNTFIPRTMENDGTFWIDYDNFLMGFSNVDIVLAFEGNHAKSFSSNFPSKKSNHRCARAFEVSLLDPQPGLPSRDTVEVYIMGIQKTRRGASSGRADRKKSYKVCDLGLLVGEGDNGDGNFTTVKGQMFGFRRDGHYRLVLNRKRSRRMVVMPISFGHPAATDKDLPFVIRFVADAPLMIRELPQAPRMDWALQKYCLESPPSKKQGIRKVLLEDTLFRIVQVDCRGKGGGVVFLCLCIKESQLQQNKAMSGFSFSVEVNCRGMSCRVATGLLEHETVSKGKKFEAAWRRYTPEFFDERQSRLLLVLYQSGQDSEFGAIKCKSIATPRKLGNSSQQRQQQQTLQSFLEKDSVVTAVVDDYERQGIFNSIPGDTVYEISGCLASSISTTEQWGLQSDTDIELERALALSRGDLELQTALEASRRTALDTRNHPEGSQDVEFQRVLEMSKQEANREYVSIDRGPMHEGDSQKTGNYDDELAKAIQLSVLETPYYGKADVVDLTEEETPPKRKRSAIEKLNGEHTTIDKAEKRRLAAEAALARMNRG